MVPMKRSSISVALAVAVFMLLTAADAPRAGASASQAATQPATQQAVRAFDLSPALFVENKGQWDRTVRYGFDGKGARVSFTDSGPVFQMLKTAGARESSETAQAVFSATFAGARPVRPTALERSSAHMNYFLGGDPSKWQTDVPSYTRLLYKGLYDGVDLYTWGKRSGLKYEFHVAPGADWRQVVVRYDGIEGLRIDEKGALHVKTALGEMVDEAPVVYQEEGGRRITLASAFRLVDETSYGFDVTDAVDPSLPLVLDPCLVFASYLGSTGGDDAMAVACDSAGNAWVTGLTYSNDFPVPGGFYTTKNAGWDVFVVRIAPNGTLAWGSFLGGSRDEWGLGIACDSAGNAFVTGWTYSPDFPTPGGFDTSYHDSGAPWQWDAFVAKITAGGSLAWSSYLGGMYGEAGYGIACDSTGNAWVTGYTASPDFPVPGGFQTSKSGSQDVFVAQITSAGSLAWASYLGGSAGEFGKGIACDSDGNAWVTGYTVSTNFPTPGGFDTCYNGPVGADDAFVARITPAGALAWASYLGGDGVDEAYGIACDSAGNAWVTGVAYSSDFPTPGGFSTTRNGACDVFAARIAPAGTLAWASYLGGSSNEQGLAIACDYAGSAWVTGVTYSSDFPTPGGFGASLLGLRDAFVSKITSAGTLAWGTYLGGNGDDNASGIACDAVGSAWVVGDTYSNNFPLRDGFDMTFSGSSDDAFIVRIGDLLITTPSLPASSVGSAYSRTLAATGGTLPYTWSVISGSLPAGLSLDPATGAITGTITASGTPTFTVQVTDSKTPPETAWKTLSIAVVSPGPMYQFNASDSEASTTNTSYQTKVTVTFTPPGVDDWIIFGFCEFKCPNPAYATFVQLFVDGVGEGQNTRKPVDPTDYLPFITVKVKNLSAGPHTIQLKYRAGNSAAAAYVRNARVCAVRRASLEFWNVAYDNAKVLTQDLQDIVNLVWTPATTGNYLVISTAEVNATTTVSTDLQTLYNNVVNDEGIIRAADNGDYTTFMSFNYCANAPAGVQIAHKISAKKVASDPTNHYVRRARILALRLSQGRFNNTAAGSGTQRTTIQTTFQQCLTTTWTYGVNGKWLFLNSARLNNSSTSCQTEVRVQLNNGPICGQQLMRPKDATDLLNFSSIDIRSLTTPRTVDMDYRTTNAAGTAMVKRLRFYGLPLDQP